MSLIARLSECAFVVCCLGGVASWFYGFYFFSRWWVLGVKARVTGVPSKQGGLLKKSLPGWAAFLGFLALGVACAEIGQRWSGGWGN